MLVGAYHLAYLLLSKEGRRLVCDLIPVKKDLTEVLAAVRYLTGLSKEKPKIGRFGYAEKMEYWAVVWGTIIMGATGLAIWFKMDVTRFVPRWLVDVGLTIHYYEAVLACLAIVVWHFYHLIFDPDVYPLNLACWDGKVSELWQQEEHPLEQPGNQRIVFCRPRCVEAFLDHPEEVTPDSRSDSDNSSRGRYMQKMRKNCQGTASRLFTGI